MFDDLVTDSWQANRSSEVRFDEPFSVYNYSAIFGHQDSTESLLNHWRRGSRSSRNVKEDYEIADEFSEFTSTYTSLAKRPVLEWATNIEIWNSFIEAAISKWGPRNAIIQVAVLASFVRGLKPTISPGADLNDASMSLCERTRATRLYSSGNLKWWQKQLTMPMSEGEQVLFATMFALTAGPSVISRMAIEFDSFFTSSNRRVREASAIIVGAISSVTRRRGRVRFKGSLDLGWVDSVSDDTISLLGFTQPVRVQREIVEIRSRQGQDYSELMHEFSVIVAAGYLHDNPLDESHWRNVIELLRNPNDGIPISTPFTWRFANHKIPSEVSRMILSCEHMPSPNIAFIDSICESEAFSQARRLIEIAEEDDWFSQELQCLLV
jgi:hypothetical protein